MVGFLSLCSSSYYYHLQLRNGSVQYELIRPIKYRPRSIIRCCSTTRGKAREDYYQVLGVTVNSTPQENKEAYRKLQKRNHPDIAGYKAYKVLMRNSSRNADASGRGFWERFHWKQVKLLEWACEKPCTLCGREQMHSRIGCRECVHHAGETSRWTMFLEALTSKSSLETWSTRHRCHRLFEFLTKHTLSLELRHYY